MRAGDRRLEEGLAGGVGAGPGRVERGRAQHEAGPAGVGDLPEQRGALAVPAHRVRQPSVRGSARRAPRGPGPATPRAARARGRATAVVAHQHAAHRLEQAAGRATRRRARPAGARLAGRRERQAPPRPRRLGVVAPVLERRRRHGVGIGIEEHLRPRELDRGLQRAGRGGPPASRGRAARAIRGRGLGRARRAARARPVRDPRHSSLARPAGGCGGSAGTRTAASTDSFRPARRLGNGPGLDRRSVSTVERRRCRRVQRAGGAAGSSSASARRPSMSGRSCRSSARPSTVSATTNAAGDVVLDLDDHDPAGPADAVHPLHRVAAGHPHRGLDHRRALDVLLAHRGLRRRDVASGRRRRSTSRATTRSPTTAIAPRPSTSRAPAPAERADQRHDERIPRSSGLASRSISAGTISAGVRPS